MGTRCPECYQGKHDNCTGWAFDARDEEVRCGCTCQTEERKINPRGRMSGGTGVRTMSVV